MRQQIEKEELDALKSQLTTVTLEKTSAVNESIGLKHEAYLTIRAEVEELEKKFDDLQEEWERRASGERGGRPLEDASTVPAVMLPPITGVGVRGILVQDWNSGDKFQYLPSSSRFGWVLNGGIVIQIVKEGDSNWPIIPYHIGRQELDIVIWNEHISFTTSKVGSLVDVQSSKDPYGLCIFYYLLQIPMEIRSLVVRFEPLRSDGSLHLNKWMDLFPSIISLAKTVQTITSSISCHPGGGVFIADPRKPVRG
ncbi:hypothetical protein IFM89_004978 [Coptis chinensis]|uniref:Uncharacterized protein n=1 Tax=Coptis chinensis TaxID=261450 RepID=A0A835HU42_9MAGN|nr:hypothetical protein IFM89_004978 [Coptis chinensis]